VVFSLWFFFFLCSIFFFFYFFFFFFFGCAMVSPCCLGFIFFVGWDVSFFSPSCFLVSSGFVWCVGLGWMVGSCFFSFVVCV